MGVADLLASVANSAAAAEPETEETETPEGEETEAPAEGDGEAADELAKKAAEGGEEESEAKDDAEADRLRQADYTRKTQALAEERKALHAEIEAERAEWAAKVEEFDEVRSWLQGLHDPDKAEYQLTRYFPQMVEALRNKWIAESGEESQMTERERAAVARARALEIEMRAKKEDEDAQRKRWEKKQETQRSIEFKQKFNAWLPAAAKAAGLDADEDTFRLIQNELFARQEYAKVQWKEDTIVSAAKAVAKALKKGAPLAPPPPKPPPSPKGTGQKAPPGANKPKAPKAKQSSEDYFKALREKYGSR